MNTAIAATAKWQISTRADGEVLTAEAGAEALRFAVAGFPDRFTPEEITGWLHDLVSVSRETAVADVGVRRIPTLLHHALTGLLFSHAELWETDGVTRPCSVAFVAQDREVGFGWVGEALVEVWVDDSPLEAPFTRVRDDEGREALGVGIDPARRIRLRLTWSALPGAVGAPSATFEATWPGAHPLEESAAGAGATLAEPPVPVARSAEPASTPSSRAVEITDDTPIPFGVTEDEPAEGLETIEAEQAEPEFAQAQPASAPAPFGLAEEPHRRRGWLSRLTAWMRPRARGHAEPPQREEAVVPFPVPSARRPRRSERVAPEPVAAAPEPVVVSPAPEPAAAPPEPVSAWLEPSAVSPEPAMGLPEPAAAWPEPAAAWPEPVEESVSARAEAETPPEPDELFPVTPAPPALAIPEPVGDPHVRVLAAPGEAGFRPRPELRTPVPVTDPTATPPALRTPSSGETPSEEPPVMRIPRLPTTPSRPASTTPSAPQGPPRLEPPPPPAAAAPARAAGPPAAPQAQAPAAPRETAGPPRPGSIAPPPVEEAPRGAAPQAPAERTPSAEELALAAALSALAEETEAAARPDPARKPDEPKPLGAANAMRAALAAARASAEATPRAPRAAAGAGAVQERRTESPEPGAARAAALRDADDFARSGAGDFERIPGAPSGTVEPIAAPAAPVERVPLRPEWPSEEELRPATPLWKKPWAWIAVVVALFGGGWLMGALQQDRGAARGPNPVTAIARGLGIGGARFDVMVTSRPPGAWIAVDGKDLVRRTPASIDLPPGEHQITLSFSELGGATFTVKGVRGDRVALDAPLWGSLEVYAADGAPPVTVLFDGRELGYAPVTVDSVLPGAHELRFSGPGSPAWGQTVEVRVAERTQVVARPMTSPATGVLEVRANLTDEEGSRDVSGAAVWVDGESRGTTPLSLELPRGPHSVRVAYRDRSAPVQVIDLPGGNQRFATFEFGLGDARPQLVALEAPPRVAAEQPGVMSAGLEGVLPSEVREMWLHVRTPEGAWRRYQMAMLKSPTGGVIGVAVFPAQLFERGERARWYASALVTTGDEYFTEMAQVEITGPPKPAAR
jgi:hypothetical protein